MGVYRILTLNADRQGFCNKTPASASKGLARICHLTSTMHPPNSVETSHTASALSHHGLRSDDQAVKQPATSCHHIPSMLACVPPFLSSPRTRCIYFLRKEQPSVNRALPPVGWHKTCEQPAQTTTVWAWEKTVVMVKQPGHLTSMKKERGPGTSVYMIVSMDVVG